MNHTRKFFVIGCAGFIGSHLLTRLLAENDNEVVGIDMELSKIEPLLDHPRLTATAKTIDEAMADGSLVEGVRWADVVINLAAICNPYEYATRPSTVIRSSLFDALPIVDLCLQEKTWTIQFSTCEVYGRTLSSYVPGENYTDPDLYVQHEDTTPLLMGPVRNQRWSYAAAKQVLERYVYALGFESGLKFTIIRPYNFFGPQMDFIPGRERDGVPRVLACFMKALLDDEPMRLVDAGTARRTITSIHDAVDAMTLMFAKPEAAQGRIFNIGAEENELTVRDLAERMRNVYADVTGNEAYRTHPIVDVTSEDFYGKGGYEDCDRRVVDASLAKTALGWRPSRDIDSVLRETVADYYARYGGGDQGRPQPDAALEPAFETLVPQTRRA